MKTKKTFTLVELIIVIAIIAILAVTAFLLLTKWLAKARDSSRASDLANLQTSLQIYLTESSKLPMPESYATISSSGTTLGYQGVFGESSKDTVGNISIAPKDPNDKEYYLYYVDSSYTKYQIGAFNENELSYNSNSVNAVDYSKRYFNTKGDKLGILLDTNQTPINQSLTGLDVSTGDTTYTAYFDNSNKLSGTGLTLQWLRSVINNGGNGFDAPRECPTGFIPVPGNKDFNQPGFCVAKYEMKQKSGTAGNYWTPDGTRTNGKRNTGDNELCGSLTPCANGSNEVMTLDGQIESKPEGMPIVYLNQATAIRSCQKMGSGYHLITNKEYMTIARNIEQQGENRNSGIIGTGGIYRGKNVWYTNTVGDLDCKGGQDWNGTANDNSLVSLGTSTVCNLSNGRNKRSLKLSNNQWIWDLAGNVREFVNKADTIDGIGYGNNLLSYSDIDNDLSNWNGGTTTTTQRHKIGWNGNSIIADARNKYGPSISSYSTGQGMGNIYGNFSNTTSNIFARGGLGRDSSDAGIFAIALNRGINSQYIQVGFRCAR